MCKISDGRKTSTSTVLIESERLLNMLFYALFLVIAAQCINLHEIIQDDITLKYSVNQTFTCAEDIDKFQMIPQVKLSDCVVECALRNHCEVMNYHPNVPVCELFGTEKSSPNRERSTSQTCIRVRKEDITVLKSPCDIPCVNGTACDRKSKNCVFKECYQGPTVRNGGHLGNKRINGSKVRFKCKKGYILRSAENTAICQNGQWNRQRSCFRLAAVGEKCFFQKQCLDENAICFPRFQKGFCHCKFGFKYDQSTESCIKGCDQYSTEAQDFVNFQKMTLHMNYIIRRKNFTSNVNLPYCVNYCVENAPLFLSLSLSRVNRKCFCRSISTEQFKFAHSNETLLTNRWKKVYDRPCTVTH
ncbi:calcium ion binding [Mactra antiquata]